MKSRSEITDLEGVVHVRTPSAILFSTNGMKQDASWLPLSMVEVLMATPDAGLGDATITLPERLAIDKGLV